MIYLNALGVYVALDPKFLTVQITDPRNPPKALFGCYWIYLNSNVLE